MAAVMPKRRRVALCARVADMQLYQCFECIKFPSVGAVVHDCSLLHGKVHSFCRRNETSRSYPQSPQAAYETHC